MIYDSIFDFRPLIFIQVLARSLFGWLVGKAFVIIAEISMDILCFLMNQTVTSVIKMEFSILTPLRIYKRPWPAVGRPVGWLVCNFFVNLEIITIFTHFK